MTPTPWEFWIDVGGTFTDCLAKSPAGKLQRHKLLSSGVTKGTAGDGSVRGQIVDPGRRQDAADFWRGFRCRILDATGSTIAESEVSAFQADRGLLQLVDNLPIAAGTAYELSCHLEAPVLAIRMMLGLPLAESVPPLRLRLGTTRGTNALLTRTGAKTALAVTRGFGDLLEIGSQERPRLFDLTVRKPAPLTDWSVEIDERVGADGKVLKPVDEAQVLEQLLGLRANGAESLAICLLHADLYPAHEQVVQRAAVEAGFTEISCSHQVAPLIKIVSRAETTVVDAYLNPVLRTYVAHLHSELPESQIRLMTSAGGLVGGEEFRGFQSVLSGPAGGVVGYARAAQSAGYRKAIGFDMGGTSTDVSRFDGHFEYEFESHKAGVRLLTPSLAIDTVAAGGGSICCFDGAKLTVGPESAGANPGPACYGRGGPLTVTDVNLFLGRIATQRFPFALDMEIVEQRLSELSAEVQAATGKAISAEELAEGLLRIANANMVRAIRGVSIAKGADPAEYLLVSFGGAAAQHACAVASELGIDSVLIHPEAGILSAYGIGQADVTRHAVQGLAKLLGELGADELDDLFAALVAQPVSQLQAEGLSDGQIDIRRTVDLRYAGTDVPLNLECSQLEDLQAKFEQEHLRQFGYIHQQRDVEVVAIRVEVIGKTAAESPPTERRTQNLLQPERTTEARFDGERVQAGGWDRENLQPGDTISGPAVIADQHSTIVVEPGWQSEMLTGGELLLLRTENDHSTVQTADEAEPVLLEIFNNLFAGVAEQMGHVLRRTAGSVNVKERLDYSCAVFSDVGELIANAPHVPVHLGAMGESVRAVLRDDPELSPGDVFITNDPYRGGSHLPDITVITPVHRPESGDLLFFTACRAHHAELGGVRPGSMPPSSRTLGEEGVLISNFKLVDQGTTREEQLRTLLTAGPYPSRSVAENLADIRAQVAANQQGASNLLELVQRYGWPTVQRNVSGIQDAAEQKVREAIAKLDIESCHFTDYLELADGKSIPIQVKIDFPRGENRPAAVIDFAGTAEVVEGNLNANRAIVTAAVLYVLRLLVRADIPLNEGALRAVDIVLPNCFLNPQPNADPWLSPAVAAGNVETSQRVVDVLLGALGLAGASQGTMNNLLFGNAQCGYYETICGGAGATAAGAGAAAVQVHMTNTRATDPEVLERRHAVRLWEFALRRASGGLGQNCGGDGVTRTLEFLEPLSLSLITGRRGPHPPYGTAGGEAGAVGRNLLTRAGQPTEELPGICEIEVSPGDRLTIQTPGGGGFGKPL